MAVKSSVFSFFAGVGILDLGFELNDAYEVVFVNEYEESFVKAYEYSREKMGLTLPKHGFNIVNATKYLGKEYSDHIDKLMLGERKRGRLVGFIAGPPCPDFSVGGKNMGSLGENGRLSLTYASLITKLKPDYFLFENVKGLWKTRKHREFFEKMKKRIQAEGYVTTEKLVNARTFGVAQDRDRIILIGFSKNILKEEHAGATELAERSFNWDKFAKYSLEEIRSCHWPTASPFKIDSELPKPKHVPEELTVQHWFQKNDVGKHANARDHFAPRAALDKFKAIKEGDDKKKSYKRLHRWRYSPTCAYGNNEVHLHPYKARRISVAEALALQSLPKNFVLPPEISLSAKFKMIGNGVPFLLAKNLADTLLYFLNKEAEKNAYKPIDTSGGDKQAAERHAV